MGGRKPSAGDLFIASVRASRAWEGVPAARAGAEQADLAVVPGLRPHPCHRGRRVADHLGVGNAALGPHLGGDVVWVARARPLIEVGADRQVAVVREPARRLDVELAPARQMVDQHHPGKRARAGRPRHVGGDRRSLVAGERDVLASHATIK